MAVRYSSVCSGNLCASFKREKVESELRAERLGIQVKKLVVEGGREAPESTDYLTGVQFCSLSLQYPNENIGFWENWRAETLLTLSKKS